jgi:hypothetical protein
MDTTFYSENRKLIDHLGVLGVGERITLILTFSLETDILFSAFASFAFSHTNK